MTTYYDFDYNANRFPTKRDMFMCLRDMICSEEKDGSDYANLCFNDSILSENVAEVHMREMKRFIRTNTLTRDEAIHSLIQILYEGSYSTDIIYLMDKMFCFLINEETKNNKPCIPYDLLFDAHFNNVTLEKEVLDGNYRWRGYLIDLFSNYYINFDSSSYAHWESISPIYDYPDPNKTSNHSDRLGHIKASSNYLMNF